MASQKTSTNQTLELQHAKLFKEERGVLRPDPESLEQPFAGEVVMSKTVYDGSDDEGSDE